MNKNITVYKIIISIVFGLMGFGANFVVINYYFYPYTATILLGLLFPLLITLVWGWKYGLLSALFGGCQSMWWIWGPSNGYAIFFVVPTFTFWIIWHGYFADLRKKQKHYKWWMNTYIIEIPFRILSTLNLYTFSRWAITMNPPSWGWAAQSSNVIPMNFSNFVVIKQAIVAYVLLLITSVLLNINLIRKFFKLKISTANFKTNYIISFSLLISVCFWIIDSIIGALTFYADRSFIDLLVTNIPPYTLYMRTALTLACLIGGIVASRLLKQQYENKERFDFAIKGTNAGVWDWNIQTGELIFNKRWAEIIGYSLNELQPISIQTWINAVHPDDLQKSNQLLEDHYKGKSDFYTCEVRMKHKNGDWIWVLDCGKVIEWIKANKPSRMIGTHIDITSLKKAEQKVKEREEDLRITLNSIGDAVIATNIDGKITRINPVAQSLTGWNLEQALGKPISDVFNIINTQTHKPAENPIQRVIREGKIVGFANDTILVSKDGTKYQIADSGAPIYNNIGKITGIVLVFRDVTKEYKMRKKMQKMERLEAIGTLAGGIAHDFNNIMMGLYGNISLAKSIINVNSKAHDCLTDAEKSMDRAKKLTNQLLTFAKGGNPVKENIDIETLINDIAIFSLSGSNVKFVFTKDDDLRLVIADKSQIEQVVSNMIINARQAMPDGGYLQIIAKNVNISHKEISELLQGQYVKITIKDEGIGIEKQHIDRIFDPYFTTKQTGNGLGLATVYSIISKHNGYIGVNSELGKGTSFNIYLPASEGMDITEKVKDTTNNCNEIYDAKILIMDNDKTVCKVTSAILENLGFSVEITFNGKQAIEIYEQSYKEGNPFDIIIMDLTIPGGIGGKEAIKDILKINPEAKVLLSSGYSNDPIMTHYTEYGFKGIVIKPYHIKELKPIIYRILKM